MVIEYVRNLNNLDKLVGNNHSGTVPFLFLLLFMLVQNRIVVVSALKKHGIIQLEVKRIP